MKIKKQLSLLIFTGIFVLFIVILSGCVSLKPRSNVCTKEAKICPDGTTVGRTGPNCEFAPCLSKVVLPEGWLKSASEKQDLTFYYPQDFPAVYMRPKSWPPQIFVSTSTYNCLQTDPTSSLSNRITEKIVNSNAYCIEALSDGAAGSIFTEYKFSREISGRLIDLSFTLQAVQCYNYDDPRQSECIDERENFDLIELVDKIFQTINFD